MLKLIAIFATSQKKKIESSNNDTNCFEKNIGPHMNYKELICRQQSSLYLQLKKKGCCMNGKKDLKESLRRKTSLGKTCSLFRQEYSE